MAMRVTENAVQVHGGIGFATDVPVERYFREAKICGIYEGTNQIQQIIIADEVLGWAARNDDATMSWGQAFIRGAQRASCQTS